MAAAKIDHNNPANQHGACPTCGASVPRTKRGTYALHTRVKYNSMGRASRQVRCDGSAQTMPESEVDAWLARRAESARRDHARYESAARDARAKAEKMSAGAAADESRARESIALAAAFEAEAARRTMKGGA